MEYSFDQFIWEVTNEAIMLRENATKEELAKLDFKHLDTMSQWGCIYGQTTGDCFSQRAAELIQLCCPRYFHKGAVNHFNDFHNVATNANGTAVVNFKKSRTGIDRNKKYYSAIEAYITLPTAKNRNLIAYLRGQAETLTFILINAAKCQAEVFNF